MDSELWNVDIWFLDKDTINKTEKYCDDISVKVKDNEYLRTAIIEIKEELIKRNLHSFDKYTSMDVYDAVINKGITDIDNFIERCGKTIGE